MFSRYEEDPEFSADKPILKHPSAIESDRKQATAKPLQALEQNAERDTLRQAIEQLPKTQRLIVTMRTYDELTFKEISNALGCTEGSAKTNFHYGLKKLKAALAGGNNA